MTTQLLEHFRCPACGPHCKVDGDDGCCMTCGMDCTTERCWCRRHKDGSVCPAPASCRRPHLRNPDGPTPELSPVEFAFREGFRAALRKIHNIDGAWFVSEAKRRSP